ncbi:Bax inhibitor-1 family protein [Lysinibacillus telephonicus]|nr:Bax inhibitor-1 family protein [Lysinibacillus telephonicus]
MSRNRNFNFILKHFVFMWVLTILGVLLATMLPYSIVIPLAILSIVLLVSTYLMQKIQLPNIILYLIPFFLGMLEFLIMIVFIEWLGTALVISVYIGTIIIFLLLAFLGLKLTFEVPDMANYLLTILSVFVVFAFIYIFIPISSSFFLILCGLFVLMFALYTVYELNIMRNNFVKDSEVIVIALGLYLNFINMFLNIREFTNHIRK